MLIVDDLILKKAQMEPRAVIWTHWDPGQDRFVKKLHLGSLLYQAGELALPITIELIEKRGQEGWQGAGNQGQVSVHE